jgi:NitT/TauT family transport system substrate-binding protein
MTGARTLSRCCAVAVAILALYGAAASAQAAPEAAPVTIVVFGAPSLGAFLPKVIKQRRLDQANGLDIDFQERTPDAYAVQFNSGEFELGGSAALLTVGLADIRGVKVSYLFNLFDYWDAVVTQRPGIDSLPILAASSSPRPGALPTTRCSNGSRAGRSSIPPRCR